MNTLKEAEDIIKEIKELTVFFRDNTDEWVDIESKSCHIYNTDENLDGYQILCYPNIIIDNAVVTDYDASVNSFIYDKREDTIILTKEEEELPYGE